MHDVKWWVFKRAGSKRFTFSWAPNPETPQKRKQVLLPDDLRTEPQARIYARDHLGELTEAKPVKRRAAAGPTVGDFAERWLDYRRADTRRAGATVRDNASHVKKWILPALGATHVMEIDVPMLRKQVREWRGKMAPCTCRNVLSTLTSFLNEIVAEGWVVMNSNPAEHKAVRSELPEAVPLVGRSQKLRLSVATAQALIAGVNAAGELVVPSERRVRYAVDLTGGYRDGEIAGLLWSGALLDANPPRIEVEGALQLKSRDGHAKPGKTKTRGSVRVVPLHPCAVAALRWWFSEGWEEHVGRKPRPEDYVFANEDGKSWRPRSAEFLRKDLEAIGEATHVSGHALTFHALRRTFPSMLADLGVPQDVRDRLMGHAGKGAGERHYTERELRVMAEHVNKIELEWRT